MPTPKARLTCLTGLGSWVLLATIASQGCSAPSGPNPENVPQERDGASTESGLPELPDLARYEASVQERLRQLHQAAADAQHADEQITSYAEAAMHYQAHGVLETAIGFYSRLLQLDSENPRWHYYHAEAQRDHGALATAVTAYRESLRYAADYVPSWVRLGDVLMDLDRVTEAATAYQAALERDRSCAPALVGLGRIDARERQFARALERFELALKINPEANNVHYHIAMAHRGLGQLERAEAHLEQRGEIRAGVADPWRDGLQALLRSTRSYTDQAQRLGRAGRLEEALELLDRAIEEDPQDALAHLYKGIAATRHGDLDAALAAFRRVTQLQPDGERAHLYIGSILSSRGDDELAVESFRTALRHHPDLTSAHLQLAKSLQRLGRHEQAIEHYARAIELDPANAEARLGRTFALIGTGSYRKARRSLENDIEVLPEQPAFAHALARVLAAAPQDDVRDGERAVMITQRLAQRMQNLELAETIAMAYAESERFEEASQWQERVIALSQNPAHQARARRLLTAYRDGRPCREPWRAEDPVFHPQASALSLGLGELAEASDGSSRAAALADR